MTQAEAVAASPKNLALWFTFAISVPGRVREIDRVSDGRKNSAF